MVKKFLTSIITVVFLSFSLTGCLAQWLNEVTGSEYSTTYEDNNYAYKYVVNTASLVITKNTTDSVDFKIPDNLPKAVICNIILTGPVTEVQANAFYDMPSLKRVELPYSCTTLGKDLFNSDYPNGVLIKCSRSVSEYAQGNEDWRAGAFVVLFDNQNLLSVYCDGIIPVEGGENQYGVYERDPAPWDNLFFTDIWFGKNVTGISDYAFSYRYSSCRLSKLSWRMDSSDPDFKINYLGDNCFAGCFNESSYNGVEVDIFPFINAVNNNQFSVTFGTTPFITSSSNGVIFVSSLQKADVQTNYEIKSLVYNLTRDNSYQVLFGGIEIDESWYCPSTIMQSYWINSNGSSVDLYIRYAGRNTFSEFSNNIPILKDKVYDYDTIYFEPDGICNFNNVQHSIDLSSVNCNHLNYKLSGHITDIISIRFYSDTVRSVTVNIPYNVINIEYEAFYRNFESNWALENYYINLDWSSIDIEERNLMGLYYLKMYYPDRVTIKYNDGVEYTVD